MNWSIRLLAGISFTTVLWVNGCGSSHSKFIIVYLNNVTYNMSFEIIIDCIMAEMFSRHCQLERIQAGNNIYPKIQISLKNDSMWGLKIQIKNNSYPIEVYRMIIYEDREHFKEP